MPVWSQPHWLGFKAFPGRARMAYPGIGGTLMTEDHVMALEKAREELRKQRRSLAKALAARVTKRRIEQIANVQQATDAMDELIKEEPKLSPATRATGAPEDRPKDRPYTFNPEKADEVFDPFDDAPGG
jgi:uncharacterized protein (DUF305 family)